MTANTFPSPAIDQSAAASSWAHRAYPDFPGGDPADTQTVGVLPIYSFADHGLGLPLDTEEVIGTAVLNAALARSSAIPPLRLLPPVRFGLIPYGPKIGAVDPETAHDMLREICLSVQRAGFRRLLFWVASPWNSELIDAASRDARIELGLQTFVIELEGVGLGLHPGTGNRAHAQAVAAQQLGVVPAVAPPAPTPPPAEERLQRPGNWANPPAQPFDPSLDGAQLLENAGRTLASLIEEIAARPALDDASRSPVPRHAPSASGTNPTPYPLSRRSRYLPSLTASALATASAAANSLVIIPVGAIEQHGPHLPVGVDAIIGEATAQALSLRLPADAPVWFGPSITYGKSNEHHTFPGTISISAKSLRRQLLALAHQCQALGFRHFALLNTHGGNSAVIDYTLREIQSELGLRVDHLRVPSTPELSPQESAWGFHAGEWETSLMLALAPALVDQSQAVCHYPARLTDPGQLRPESAPAIFSWQTDDIAPDGVMGDATAATAGKGTRWFNAAMDQLTASLLRSL